MTSDATQPGSTPPLSEITSRFATSIGRGIIASEFGSEIFSNPEALVFDPADLKGRVAFITGGSSGLGRATAMLFAESGALVVITGRDEERTHATRRAIEKAGGKALSMVGDMRKSGIVQAAVSETVDQFGRIDIGILNAGVINDADPIDMTVGQWYDVVHDNADMTFFPAQAIARQMINQDGSVPKSLVYISSIAMMGNSGQPNYSFTKAGGESLMKAFARSKNLKDVSVGILRAGLIDTEMLHRMGEKEQKEMDIMARAIMPLKRKLTPEEGANAVAYIATLKESGHILTLT